MKRFLLLLMIMLLVPWPGLIAQTNDIRVSGTVRDEAGNPIVGATVQLVGFYSGTTTDARGSYAMNVPPSGSILKFSFPGCDTQEIPVKEKELNVTLQESIAALEQVVVVGYGEIRKRDITGAIASVSSEKIDLAAPVSVFDALQGQVAGLEIVSGSGAPGESSMIRIRGTATFEAGAQPLYVVDGVVYDNIDDLNPADIQSVEVLKDAASAAIYGSRSANGVFLITTKKGEIGKMKMDIRYLQSHSQLTREMPKANAYERKYYDNVRRLTSGQRNEEEYGFVIADTLANFTNQDQNLQKLIFRTARRDEVNINGSGGTEKFDYYLSTSYFNEQGIIINSKYNRITSRVNAEYKPNQNLTMGSKLYFSYSNKDGISENNVLNQLLERVPYWAIFNQDGSLVPNISNRRNPYAVALTDINKTQNYKATLNDYFILKIGPHFTFNTNIQASFALRRGQEYRQRNQLNSNERSTGTDYTSLNYDWTNENYLSYKRTFAKNHKVEAMTGCSFQYWHREPISLVGVDFSSDEVYTLNAASGFDARESYTRIYEHSMASFFGRVGYSYKGKYLANTNLRYDGSSRFGRDHRWGAFPSASVAWRFSGESFLKWAKPLLTDGKLRMSYGVTGNESIPDYASQLLYSPDYIYDGVAGIAASNLRYDGLSWEETSQFNAGLDLMFKKSKIQIAVDYYIKNTDRLLNKVDVPKEISFRTMYMNVGEIQNKGFEISVDAELLRTKTFRWNANVNFTTNNALIKRLAGGVPFYKGHDEALYIQEGGRLGEFYGYKYLGVFAYDESNAFTEDGRRLTPVFDNLGYLDRYTLNGQTYDGPIHRKRDYSGNVLLGGDVDFEDKNGDGIIDAQDKQVIGCAQPDFFGGVGTSVSYKNFRLTMQFFYSIGGEIYNYAEAKRNRFRADGATPSPEAIYNMWAKQGDNARWPAPIVSDHNTLAPSNFYLEDASYIRLKNIRLSYDLPSKWISKMYLKSARLYVYGKNLLTFTNYKGYDPEFADNSDPLVMGIDPNRYPRGREFGFGINLGF